MTAFMSSTEPLPSPSHSATTAVEEEARLSPGDHERFAHYVRKEKILASQVEGKPVIALCGKVWVPVRNPDAFPLCPVCKEIYAQMRAGGGDDAGL